MSLSCRQQLLLERIDDEVCRTDPRLASMLAIFARLTAGEEMPAREQLRPPALSPIRAAVLMAAAAVAALITRAAASARAVRSAAAASTAKASRLAGGPAPAGPAAARGFPAADAGSPPGQQSPHNHERRTSC